MDRTHGRLVALMACGLWLAGTVAGEAADRIQTAAISGPDQVAALGGGQDLSLVPPPPRTINDVFAALDQHRGDTAALKKARDLADRAPPAGKDPNKPAEHISAKSRYSLPLGASHA